MTTSPPALGPDAEFRRCAEAGELALQRCADCGSWIFQPRMLCPQCGSARLDWRTASGRGHVHSVAILRQRPEKGGDRAVVLVDLAEGPRMMSRLPDTRPEDIAIGMPVRARIVVQDGGPVVVFDPDGAARE
jgi:uncharacterized protein